jgi:hypothetical protein
VVSYFGGANCVNQFTFQRRFGQNGGVDSAGEGFLITIVGVVDNSMI